MQTFYRTNDIDPGGDAIKIATSATSVSTVLPTLENSDKPRRVRVTVAGSQLVWFTITNGGATATDTIGTLVSQFAPVIVKAGGRTHFNHIANATGSIINVTPLNE